MSATKEKERGFHLHSHALFLWYSVAEQKLKIEFVHS